MKPLSSPEQKHSFDPQENWRIYRLGLRREPEKQDGDKNKNEKTEEEKSLSKLEKEFCLRGKKGDVSLKT